MSTGTADLLSPAGAPSSRAALDRVHRNLYEELGPQRGPAGAGLARAQSGLPIVVSGSFHLLAAVCPGPPAG
jgi:hypothetical protein